MPADPGIRITLRRPCFRYFPNVPEEVLEFIRREFPHCKPVEGDTACALLLRGTVVAACLHQRTDDVHRVKWVTVDPSHRAIGLGRLLLDTLLRYLGTFREVELTINSDTCDFDRAHSFYLGLGFA